MAYEDIINLEYKKSTKHNHMSLYDRAAQFSPFAALTGYEDSIIESGRIVNKKIELTSEKLEIINYKLNIIKDNINNKPIITIKYFDDDNKNGGIYLIKEGIIKRIDEVEKVIIFSDKTKIKLENIYSINSTLFNEYLGDL